MIEALLYLRNLEWIEYKGYDHLFDYWGNWVWWLLGIYVCTPVLVYVILPFFTVQGGSRNRRSIGIFVLGDIGHSPRMCYHALSFSKMDYFVQLCGYLETEPPIDVIDDENIDIIPIPVTKNSNSLPFLAFAIKKVCIQIIQLFKILFSLRGSDYIMLQNPPSLPILLISIIFIKVFSKRTKLVIDWHNLNFTILNLKYNNLNNPFVRFLKLYEKHLGKFADLNITVTDQMKKYLVSEFGFKKTTILTLHDRPSSRFEPFSKSSFTKEEIFRNHELFNNIENVSKYKILISSTSFTPDEDFNILLDALKKYEASSVQVPPILLIITGKGPLKSQFLARVKELKFSDKILVKSAWLSAEDYPIILSIADLGVSLHTSSSGIDLPMKIVDFFGCGVPVISLRFPAIGELVKDNVNGLICKDNENEDEELLRLLTKAFTDSSLMTKIKQGAMEESNIRWDDNWREVMHKYFKY